MNRVLVSLLAGMLLWAAVQHSYAAFTDPQNQPHFRDTEVYWTAGRAAQEHRTAYDVQGHYAFNYPPFAATLYGWTLAQLPLTEAGLLWYQWARLGWAAVFAWLLFRWPTLSRTQFRFPEQRIVAASILMLLCNLALHDELKLGQTTLVVVLVFTLMQELERRGRNLWIDVATGLLLGLGVQMKIQFALVVFGFLLKRRWGVALAAFLSHILFSGLLCGLEHGWQFAYEEHSRWIASVIRYTQTRALEDHFNVSPAGVVAKLYGRHWSRYVLLAIGAGFFAALYRKRRHDTTETSAFALHTVTLLNPVVWPYWLLLNAPSMTRWLAFGVTRHRWLALTFGCGIFWLGAQTQNTPAIRDGSLTWPALLLWVMVAWMR